MLYNSEVWSVSLQRRRESVTLESRFYKDLEVKSWISKIVSEGAYPGTALGLGEFTREYRTWSIWSDLIVQGNPTGRWGTFGSLSERCGWIVKVILLFLCFPLCCLSRANGQSWGIFKHRNRKRSMGREDRRVHLWSFTLPMFLVHLVIFGGDLWAHNAARCRHPFQTHSLSVFLLLTTARFPPKVLGWYSVILKYIRINIL